jgi:hypothetical protein
LLTRSQAVPRGVLVTEMSFIPNSNQPPNPNPTLGTYSSVVSTLHPPFFDSSSVSASKAHRTDAEPSGELHNHSNGVSVADVDGLTLSLEKLMAEYVPCDLSGLVDIHDFRNPDCGGLADVHLGSFDNKKVPISSRIYAWLTWS